ncbi:protein RIC-3b [Silurus meridionalis]|uniref:protein RIC-3b n=1 Tax=Silurus meridionalis TaxID=175797 RepID=UPI001EE9F30A|nr:protein RIC-3b [Silurus meridionalis]
MSMSTFQKVTVVSCVCVCVALLLPKLLLSGGGRGGGGGGGRRDPAGAEGGRFPPMLQRRSVSVPPRGAGGNSAHPPEAIARAKGSTGTMTKSNLAGQIIPVYGFGILLYILYIIFKITSKGKASKCEESRFPAVRSENMKRKITDFELSQLQERLKETEEVMERIVSRAQRKASKCEESRFPAVRSENMKRKITDFELSQLQERLKETEEVMERIVSRAQSGNTLREECVSVDQEENLLLQLREITRVMQEGRLVDVIPSETETPECDQEFTDDPDEMLKHWSSHFCTIHHQPEEGGQQSDRKTEKETERTDRQMDEKKMERAESGSNEEEICTGTKQSEHQCWNTSVSGSQVSRRRGGRGTTRGTESFH